ncbi:hypothetical protein K488DRAFT_84783 [Vararia minispora EC-137]|uniref:Uncharacterized protein n=1 Tax=Vararia minispora EC-137 TaxID=1314806 RepID=A0ACB8QPV8_9AGAM|nr:hypothetical protein K488DRAFT_84783 [Vararia minispora EC-137]
MSTSLLAGLLAEVESALVQYRASIYVSIASLTFLMYDHLLTFADEVEFVWNAPSSLPKWFFLVNRYALPMLISVCVHIIILVRLWVLWERQPLLVAWTLFCFLVAQAVTFVVLGMTIRASIGDMNWNPATQGPTDYSPITMLFSSIVTFSILASGVLAAPPSASPALPNYYGLGGVTGSGEFSHIPYYRARQFDTRAAPFIESALRNVGFMRREGMAHAA